MNREEIRQILRDEVEQARAVSKIADDQVDALLRDIPSSLPHPDGVQRIRNASVEAAEARTRLMHAVKREASFLVNGTLPESDPTNWLIGSYLLFSTSSLIGRDNGR